MKRARIALFDMDNTLCDYTGAMVRGLNDMKSPGEVSRGIIGNLEPWEEARVDAIKARPGWWRELRPIEMNMKYLRMALAIGYECQILTKGPWRTTSAWTEKVEWCREHLPSEVKVTITEDKSTVYGRVLFDDWPEYVKAWLEYRPRGLAFMPAHGYNEKCILNSVVKYDHTTPEDVIRTFLLEMYERD